MGKIKILEHSVVEHIAAGEIIDRPSSIVKELIENSLDAKATRIEVEISGGGIEQIVITDNGVGMDEGDAALSLQRHATSKLLAIEDLDSIRTFGFRGEALASVAAVSRLELYTREASAQIGTRIAVNGGSIESIEPTGSPVGTRIVMRDLFFNIPARRKFLKQAHTEESHCMDIIGKVAMARPDVAFQVKKNGKNVYSLSQGESVKARFLKLFPQTEENQLFEIESLRDSFKLHGIIGAPLFSKASRNSILFYVNQRFVRPGVLSQAIVDGYSGYLQAGKFPVVVLFLEIDGRWVDVNVHPTKAEVRFSHAKEVYGFVEKMVALRLKEVQENVRPHVIANFVPSYSSGTNQSQARYEDLTLFEKLTPYEPKSKTPQILGSVAKTYGLFQEEETLFLVDLHNAHERINFDMLEARLRTGNRPAQELLAPLTLEFSSAQKNLIQNYWNFLRDMGLELEDFGENTILMRSIPAGLEQLGNKRFLLSLLEKLTTIDEIKDPEALQKKILITMACRSSIQAGDEISNHEMQSLFEKLLRASNPYFCPHGRPIIIKLTLDEVHRLFRRK